MEGQDLRGEVVEAVGARQLVEEEEGDGQEEPAAVAGDEEDFLEDDAV